MDSKKKIGDKAEKTAIEFLKNKGYDILDANWYYKHKEIDIVAQTKLPNYKYPLLVFIEVKSRSYKYSKEVMPYHAVNRQKQRYIIEAANAYIERKNLMCEVRYDIVSIINFPDEQKIQHIEDAFYPIVK